MRIVQFELVANVVLEEEDVSELWVGGEFFLLDLLLIWVESSVLLQKLLD
jgi:hypothetical protein